MAEVMDEFPIKSNIEMCVHKTTAKIARPCNKEDINGRPYRILDVGMSL